MAKVDMFSKPKMEADLVVSGTNWVSPPKMAFKVVVDIDDKIFKQIKSDGILLEEMNKAVQKVYEQTCDSIKGKLKAFDKLVDVMVDKNAPQSEIDKQLAGLNKSIEQDRSVAEKASEAVALDCWKKYAAKKKEYLKYGLKITATIVGTAAGLATSIGLTAAGGFTGGASAFFGVLGMVKSVITLGKEIGSAWMEVETAQAVLVKQIGFVGAALKKTGAKKANELGGAVASQFLGISQPTIKNCVAQMDTVEKKLIGIEIKTHEASKFLNKILDEEEKVKKDFMKEVVAKLSKHSSPKAKDQIKKIEGKLDEIVGGPFRTIETQLSTVHELHDRFVKAEAKTAKLREKVDALNLLRTLDEKIFENLLILVDIPLAAVGAMEVTDAAKKASQLVEGLTPTLTFLVYDKVKGKVLEDSWLV